MLASVASARRHARRRDVRLTLPTSISARDYGQPYLQNPRATPGVLPHEASSVSEEDRRAMLRTRKKLPPRGSARCPQTVRSQARPGDLNQRRPDFGNRSVVAARMVGLEGEET